MVCGKKSTKGIASSTEGKANTNYIHDTLIQLLSNGEMAKGKVYKQLVELSKQSKKTKVSERTVRTRIKTILTNCIPLHNKDNKLFQLVEEPKANRFFLYLKPIT